jgi:hypothetical protein
MYIHKKVSYCLNVYFSRSSQTPHASRFTRPILSPQRETETSASRLFAISVLLIKHRYRLDKSVHTRSLFCHVQVPRYVAMCGINR